MGEIIPLDNEGYENLILSKFGTDMDSATAGALRSDLINFGRQLVQTYQHQPEMADMFPHFMEPVEFNGMDQFEFPTFDDLPAPIYKLEPIEKHVSLKGTRINEPVPELSMTARRRVDKWRQPFAGRDRVPRLLSQMAAKMREYRDIKLLRGDSNISSTQGWVPGATAVSTNGAWDVESNSDGVLTNAQADLKDHLDAYDAAGYNGFPLVIGLTSYAHTILRVTIKSHTDTSNLGLWMLKLPEGSRVLRSSNNLQETVTDSSNTMLSTPDFGTDVLQACTYVQSGVQQVARELGFFDFGYAQRQRVFSRVTLAAKARKTTSIDTTT